jgi:hypothetical protein
LKLGFLALFAVRQEINWVDAWEEAGGILLKYVHFDEVSAVLCAHILAQ